MQRACWLPPGAAPVVRKSRVLPGGDGLWVLYAALAYFCVPIFFAFRFVSDFRRRQPIATIQEIFTDRSSETKWPLGSKRNAPLKRAGKPPEGSRRNLRDTGGEKIVGRSGMASGKKPFARRGALRSCPQSGDRAAAARCPRALKPRALRTEFPHPFCASGPADRGVDQGTRFYRSRPVRRGHHRYCRGRTVCDGAGDGHGCCALHPAARSPG